MGERSQQYPDANIDVPPADWGVSHWTAFRTVIGIIEREKLLKVAYRNTMRTSREMMLLFRIVDASLPESATQMAAHDGSVLADGAYIPEHCDWCCLRDFAAAGFLKEAVTGLLSRRQVIFPKAEFTLSPLGEEIAADLREHIRNGGRLDRYVYPYATPRMSLD